MAATKKGSEAEKQSEADRVEEKSTPATPVIYEIVRRVGEEEMSRPAMSLWWSGVAAGLSMGFSVIAVGVLRMHLPDTAWRPLLLGLGFPVGFLMAVLGRQQLFTENTITVVLPIMAKPSARNFGRAGRMWAIVLAANLTGTLCMALVFAFTPLVGHELRTAMLDVSREGMNHEWLDMACLAILPGFLMAALVWLNAGSGGSQFAIVTLITYLIGTAGFSHIVSGSIEAFLLTVTGELGVGEFFGRFLAPVLAGNIIGGTALFALLSHGQVMREI
jgi:formate/nitrite transporter FocA (FNT family)